MLLFGGADAEVEWQAAVTDYHEVDREGYLLFWLDGDRLDEGGGGCCLFGANPFPFYGNAFVTFFGCFRCCSVGQANVGVRFLEEYLRFDRFVACVDESHSDVIGYHVVADGVFAGVAGSEE